MVEVRWPATDKGKAFIRKVKGDAKAILGGRFLAIDPGSNVAGYALYERGEFVESGLIQIKTSASVSERLRELHQCLAEEFPQVDVLAVEMLRGGKVHPTLNWAVGATVAAIQAGMLLEVPISFWKALAKTKPTYKKRDDADAELIAETVIMLAKAA